MKRVIIVSYHFPPCGGKAVQRASKLAKFLPEYGWQPIVFTMPLNEPDVPVDFSLLEELPSCVEIHRPHYRNWWKLLPYDIRKHIYKPVPDQYRTWADAEENSLVRLIHESKAHALISTSPTHSAQLLGLAAKKRTDIPWIADFRDPWTGHPDFASKRHAELMRNMETSVLESADAIVGVYPKILRDFNDRIPSSRMYLLENGYDESDFRLVDWNKKNDHEALWIGYNGTVSDFHDPCPLLEPLESLVESGKLDPKTIHIVFTTGKKGMKRFARFNNLLKTGVLEVCDYLPHAESLVKLSEMDISILLLTRGGNIYPGKIFEYFYLGNPILSLSTPGDDLDMLIRKTGTGTVVDYRDSNAVTKAVLNMIEMKKRGDLARRGKPGNEISHFSRRHIARRYAEILEKISGV